MENKSLAAALFYLNRCGFSVIPAKQDKRPLVKWEDFQKQRPSEEQVKQWWGKDYPGANIAIITGAVSNLTVLDIDTEDGRQRLDAITPQGFRTPTVDTPSGGEHRYCRYEEGTINAVRFIEGCDIRSEGGYVIAPPSENGKNAWEWREGLKLTTLPIASIPALILDAIRSFSSVFNRPVEEQTSAGVRGQIPPLLNFGKGTRDVSMFHLAHHLTKGQMPKDEIEYFLSLVAGTLCNPPYSKKEVFQKVQSAMNRAVKAETNIMQEVKDFIAVTTGNFRVSEVYSAVTRLTNVTQNNKGILMALSRLVKEGAIERLKAPGTYRVIEKSESLNINDVHEIEPAHVALPFGLDKYVTLYPGNLIVLAGITNAGKTAVILEMIRHNMGLHKCWYLSTEISARALKSRIRKSEDKSLWDFEIIESWGQEPDALRPDDLNFCDWIEAGEEPHRIALKLSRIQERMKKGIAVVAVQKNPWSEYAFGGFQSMAKAALYINIDRVDKNDITKGHFMKIMKAKAFEGENPNGFTCEFKTVRGIDLIPTREWGPDVTDRYEQFRLPTTKRRTKSMP